MSKENHSAVQCRIFNFDASEPDTAGRIPVVISTDAPVRMVDGDEILTHTPDAVDLTRAPLPIIATHQSGQINVGVVEDIIVAGGKMRGMARFGERQEAVDYARDVANKIIRSVSVGYQRIKGYIRSDNVLITTRWMPMHAALVAEPADPGAGFYREQPAAQPCIEWIDAPADPATTEPDLTQTRAIASDLPAPSAGATNLPKGDRTMQHENQAPAADHQPAAHITVVDNALASRNLIASERERVREIRATGRQLGLDEALVERAISSDTSLDAFRAEAIGQLTDSGRIRVAESPEIGMSTKDIEKFSFCRALLAVSDPLNAAKYAPFEVECSRAAQDRRGDQRSKGREAAITIPADVLSRGISITPDVSASVQRMFNARQQRDLNIGTTTAGGNLVATELLGSSFIDLLRNAMVLDKLGITWLRDLVGNIAIPSATGAATGYWITEGNPPTESQQTIGQVALTPKTVGAYTDYTRKLLLQASLDVEAFIRADLANVVGQTIQLAAINGSGSAPEPYGILNTSGIGSVAGGAAGLAPAYTHMVDLETAVGNANADVGSLGFLTNSKVRGILRKTQEFSSTNGKAVWTNGRERGMGDILGYDAYVTNSVPSNLVKGGSGAVCSAVIFGNFADLVIGMWGGLDLMLDPYALATSGGKRVIALQDVDINLRRVASFAAMKDALTA
jgi:HK97 family phage major capsid protein